MTKCNVQVLLVILEILLKLQKCIKKIMFSAAGAEAEAGPMSRSRFKTRRLRNRGNRSILDMWWKGQCSMDTTECWSISWIYGTLDMWWNGTVYYRYCLSIYLIDGTPYTAILDIIGSTLVKSSVEYILFFPKSHNYIRFLRCLNSLPTSRWPIAYPSLRLMHYLLYIVEAHCLYPWGSLSTSLRLTAYIPGVHCLHH